MANLYGVSNPVILPVSFTTIGATNVALPSGSETVVGTSTAIAALSAGVYYPQVWGTFLLFCNGGALTGFSIAAKIGAGADFQTIAFQATMLPASAIPLINFTAVGPVSTVPWQGAGSTVSVSATATGNAALAIYPGTWFYVALYRAPDQ